MPFFQKEKTLFRLFGLPIKANLSWLLLVGLVLLSLALGYFPQSLGEGKPWHVYWGLAALGTVGLFASLIAHELCHSLVARSTGMPVEGITLFIFGGVSQLSDEPPTAQAEFFMAVVGPLSSVVIGAGFLVLWVVGSAIGWSEAPLSLLRYLFFINFALAAFNSLPAFPLDGGRVVRSVLWGVTDNLRAATNVAANIGSFFGIGMIVLGLFALFKGYPLPGLWFLVLGFFLRQAALGSLRMVIIRQQLEGEKVRDFMTTDVVTVPEEMNVQEFVDNYVFHHRFSYYPVVDEDDYLVGMISARAPRGIDAEQWSETSVAGLMNDVEESMVLEPDADAVDALAGLRKKEENRAVIVEKGKPVGILSLRDLLQFLALKIDLEPRAEAR